MYKRQLLALCAALGVGVFRFYLSPASDATAVSLEDVPTYSGAPYVELDGNVPAFTDEELTTTAFESYSPLDALEMCIRDRKYPPRAPRRSWPASAPASPTGSSPPARSG